MRRARILFAAPPPAPPRAPPLCTHALGDLQAVKICAVTSAADAALVCKVSRRVLPDDTRLLLGMILWPHSRRSVDKQTARAISAIARGAGATPVAVFVDEDEEAIRRACGECDIAVAQLHGASSRASWTAAAAATTDNATVPVGTRGVWRGGDSHVAGDDALQWIDVRDVSPDGVISPATLPDSQVGRGAPLWTIFDAKGGGTGKPFDWDTFSPPSTLPARPWLLAGGLDPSNVGDAVHALRPAGLDVATGVAGADKCAKDADRLEAFLRHTVAAYSSS